MKVDFIVNVTAYFQYNNMQQDDLVAIEKKATTI